MEVETDKSHQLVAVGILFYQWLYNLNTFFKNREAYAHYQKTNR